MSHPKQHTHLDLVIRATNGAPWETHEFKDDDTVEEVIRKAVKHFVKAKIMTEGEYDLVLVVDGAARPPLHPGDRLEDVDVASGSVLALVPHEPQVDG